MPPETDERELLRLTAEYRRCVVGRDAAALDRLLDDGYFAIGPDGASVETKEGLLDDLRRPGNTAEYLGFEDVVARVYGDSGVVHAVVNAGGISEGQAYASRGRDAHWYARREGRWRMVSVQRSPIGWRPAGSEGDEAELRELDAELLGARVRRDPAIAEPVLADDFLSLSGDGEEGTRESELGLIEKDTGVESLETDEVEVRMYGEAAAVVSLVTARKGEGVESRFRLTRLYARWDGRWRAVMQQTTPVAPGEDASR